MFWVTENGIDWIPVSANTAPVAHAHMAAIGRRVVMIGGVTGSLGVVTGDLVLGPARPPASQSAPPANFALSLQLGNVPMIADVNSDFALGPVTTSKDRFLVFATGPTGTSIFSSPDGSLWSRETPPAGLTPTGGVTGRPVMLQAIPDGQGGVVAVGKITNNTGDNGMVWHLTQSGKWKQAQFQDDTPPEFSSITTGPAGLVISSDKAGGSQIMYSTDTGDTWQAGSIAVGDGFALTVGAYRFGFVAVGTDPARQGATTAWTSPDGRTWTIRTDWHLPPKVTALFGLGNTLVAAAATAPPAAPGTSAGPSGSAGATAATGSALPSGPAASAAASANPTPAPTAKPTTAPVAAPTTTTWWWSPTGVAWQQSGLVSSGGNFAVVNGQILVFDAPAKSTANWTAWTSSDGKNWRKPTSDPVAFVASRSCAIASLGTKIVIVGWDAPGALKDYLGKLANE
jgi:cell division septation protein DedD